MILKILAYILIAHSLIKYRARESGTKQLTKGGLELSAICGGCGRAAFVSEGFRYCYTCLKITIECKCQTVT